MKSRLQRQLVARKLTLPIKAEGKGDCMRTGFNYAAQFIQELEQELYDDA